MFENKGIVEDIPDGITENTNMAWIASYLWRNRNKTERLIEAAIFLLLNKTEHFILKRNTLYVNW